MKMKLSSSVSRSFLSTTRRLDGFFITKCIAVTCAFIFLEGFFLANRWVKSSIVTTEELNVLIPLQKGDYKERRKKLFETLDKESTQKQQLSAGPAPPTLQHPVSVELQHKRDLPLHLCPIEHDNILFFIRIPKCASTSFVHMVESLSQQEDFEVIFNPSGAYNWNNLEMAAVVEEFNKVDDPYTPILYARHFYYVDFREHGLGKYSYVTVIREPTARFVSSYLYYHFSSKAHIQRMLKREDRNETIAQCIAKRHNGCSHNLLTKYFCGHQAFCSMGNAKALETAKRHIRNNFAMVGILENLEVSVKVIKKVLPLFFSHASKSVFPKVNKNEHAKNLTLTEELAVKNANLADIELYRYSKEILLKLADTCGVAV